ncbi:Dynein light chain roadblock-type-like protein [Hapsidospora chrysogenum ATCC 11550]|uniref:Dynein light chain roadblock-type-like protein n=1 Tax=Hapsidospora chrysogenum (strain ATCC 11550 / CBS 779.69 / DSM 880 / IAM 14645 / JCM 23072 / IMI 49137) TaxID=857340 RepID=A0A086TB49_HAPC1|nr:Dynein light chain roadblock-type-like protein [Hapsidospora chrysogenum ATCC 11550]
MADPLMASGLDALEEKLGRLTRKPGVKASIVLDRSTGSILKTSGDMTALRTSKSRNEATAASFSNEVPAAEESESKGLEEFARMIWNYVNTSGQLVQDLDTEDELKLLRLRTKKQEIVIVPDPKYLLTVVHDTPPA